MAKGVAGASVINPDVNNLGTIDIRPDLDKSTMVSIWMGGVWHFTAERWHGSGFMLNCSTQLFILIQQSQAMSDGLRAA